MQIWSSLHPLKRVFADVKSGGNFCHNLGPRCRKKCLPYVTVLYLNVGRVLSRIYRLGEKSRVAEGDELPRGSGAYPPPEILLNDFGLRVNLVHFEKQFWEMLQCVHWPRRVWMIFPIYRVFQKFVPIVNCTLRKAFNASLGKCKLIQVRNYLNNLSKHIQTKLWKNYNIFEVLPQMCVNASFFPAIFFLPILYVFYFRFFSRFLLFSVLFHENEGLHCLC